jgi:hypothetical protein
MTVNGRRPRRRRFSTFSVVVVFLIIVAALVGLEFYALWSDNRAHSPLPPPSVTPANRN